MLAASGDNGYTGFLRKYAPTQGTSNSVTLIEARPFPAQLRQIASSFRIEKFPRIFRKSDLCLTTSQSSMQNHTSAVDQNDEVPFTMWNSFGPVTYTTGAGGAQTQIPPHSPPASSSDLSNSVKNVYLYFNQNGHRIDPVIRYNKQLCASLRDRKLCHAFFLSRCELPSCGLDHRSNLSHEELTALRYIARLSPCGSVHCRDANCISGHVCPRDGRCLYRKKCKFPAEMHNVDTKIDDRRTFMKLLFEPDPLKVVAG